VVGFRTVGDHSKRAKGTGILALTKRPQELNQRGEEQRKSRGGRSGVLKRRAQKGSRGRGGGTGLAVSPL